MTEFVPSQPDNTNGLSTLNHTFVMQRLPTVKYFCQVGMIPAVSIGTVEQPTPFMNIPRPAQKMEFEQYELTFMVDEDIKNYLELFNWITPLGSPDNWSQYNTLIGGQTKSSPNVFSDASMLIYDSAKRPNIRLDFEDMFPIRLSGIEFDVREDESRFATCTATFKYRKFNISRVT